MNVFTRGNSATARWTAGLTGVLLALTMGGTAAQAGPIIKTAAVGPATVVSLTFDDANADQATAVATMNQLGLKGTFFVPTGWVGLPGYFTQADLAGMVKAGQEIAGHTVNHPDLATLPAAEAARQICQGRATLAEWSIPTRSFAYPFATVNPALEAAVKNCGFNSARGLGDLEGKSNGVPTGVGYGFAESVPPADLYATRAPDEVDSTWTLADLEKSVTNAETTGGWLQLTFHHICDTGCDPTLTTTPAIFSQFATWLAARGTTNNTTVKTVGDVIGGGVQPLVGTTVPAPPGPGVNGVINPGLETAGAGGMPQCWQKGGYGTNTATFSTVTTAHTGVAAEQLVVTGLTSGDAKAIVTQDLGDCAPSVTPGQTYSLRAWYTSTIATQFDIYLRNSVGVWSYWTSSTLFPASPTFVQASATTAAIPAGTTGISFGLNLIGNGTLVTDDYALYNTVGAPAVGGPPAVVGTRLSGPDRYATAVDISSKSYTPGVARVYVANGNNFPDALTAAPAAAHFKSPVLLTPPDALPTGVRDEISRLKPAAIVVVGGSDVVSDAILTALKAIAPTTRVSGPDRYATSRAIAQDAFGSGATSAYIATGANFPDALASGPAATHFGGPTILVPGANGGIDDATKSLLTSLKVTAVRIAGGTDVVSTGIENALKVTPGVATVKRNSGDDRYATAVSINLDAFATSPTAYLAVGSNFPDAMAGAALAGWKDAPLYLTTTACIDQRVAADVKRLGASGTVLFGGPDVLSDNVLKGGVCG